MPNITFPVSLAIELTEKLHVVQVVVLRPCVGGPHEIPWGVGTKVVPPLKCRQKFEAALVVGSMISHDTVAVWPFKNLRAPEMDMNAS